MEGVAIVKPCQVDTGSILNHERSDIGFNEGIPYSANHKETVDILQLNLLIGLKHKRELIGKINLIEAGNTVVPLILDMLGNTVKHGIFNYIAKTCQQFSKQQRCIFGEKFLHIKQIADILSILGIIIKQLLVSNRR